MAFNKSQNIYAETTFVCPSYWMAEGYTDKGRKSYSYQNSVLPAVHESDMTAYFGPAAPYQGPDLLRAMMSMSSHKRLSTTHLLWNSAMWGNFVTTDNPSLSAAIANGSASSDPLAANAATDWPPFTIYAPYQLNVNQSGGTLYELPPFVLLPLENTTVYVEPGLRNNFTLSNAYTWEAGRGYRCDFWRSVAAIVPE